MASAPFPPPNLLEDHSWLTPISKQTWVGGSGDRQPQQLPQCGLEQLCGPFPDFSFFLSLKGNHTFVFSPTGSPLQTGGGRSRNPAVV